MVVNVRGLELTPTPVLIAVAIPPWTQRASGTNAIVATIARRDVRAVDTEGQITGVDESMRAVFVPPRPFAGKLAPPHAELALVNTRESVEAAWAWRRAARNKDALRKRNEGLPLRHDQCLWRGARRLLEGR